LQTCTPLAVESPSPLTSVAFHQDDRFLATAGRKISLFSVQSLNSLGNLSLETETPGFSSIAIAAGQPSLAAGTSCGCVAVWDYKTKQQVYIDTSRHIGGTTAVQFAPLDPGVLYSTGKDGALLMQDLRAGPFHVPTARIGAGIGLTTLSIREDFTYLAAGTVDGRVLLYDPRYCAAPAATLRCGDPAPVSTIQWQHNYQSLTSRAKDAVAHAVAEGTFPAGRLSMALSVQSGEESTGDFNFPAADKFAAGGTPGSAATNAQHNRLSLASSLPSYLEPPRNLDLSPIANLREGGAPGALGEGRKNKPAAAAAASTTSISEYHAALSRLRRESTTTNTTVNAPPPPSRSSALPPLTTAPVVAAVPDQTDAELSSQAALPAYTAHTQDTALLLPSPLPPLSPLASAVEAVVPAASDYSAGEPSWQIKAMTPRRGAAAAIDRTDATDVSSRSNMNRREAITNPAKSPSKAPLVAMEKCATTTGTPPAASKESPPSQDIQFNSLPVDGHALQQDILAMHLDMLTHFKEQERANAALVAGIMAKHDALADEVAALRQELRDLLSRRDNTLWL